MKSKWNNNQIKQLFDLVAKNSEANLSALESFRVFAKKYNKNTLSVRNFYYQQLKLLKQNPNLAIKMDIDISKHKVQNFKHFNKQQETILKSQIEQLTSKGFSVRNACEQLCNGDIAQMLRLQNKYRSIKKSECKVIQFPSQKTKKQTLTDEEIKSLFMGLVKLVKENEIQNNQQSINFYIEQNEMQKRKGIVLLKQKQSEIDALKQEISNLKQKNQELNKKLTKYRVEYLLHPTNQQ